MNAQTIYETPGLRSGPTPAATPDPRRLNNDLERLKNQLLRETLSFVASPALVAPIRRAANEAAALAWLEPNPLLVFPVLFEEKVKGTRRRAHRQSLIRARSEGILPPTV